jgi:hypothetical protein
MTLSLRMVILCQKRRGEDSTPPHVVSRVSHARWLRLPEQTQADARTGQARDQKKRKRACRPRQLFTRLLSDLVLPRRSRRRGLLVRRRLRYEFGLLGRDPVTVDHVVT